MMLLSILDYKIDHEQVEISLESELNVIYDKAPLLYSQALKKPLIVLFVGVPSAV